MNHRTMDWEAIDMTCNVNKFLTLFIGLEIQFPCQLLCSPLSWGQGITSQKSDHWMFTLQLFQITMFHMLGAQHVVVA